MLRILLIDNDLMDSNQITKYFKTDSEKVDINHLSTPKAVEEYLTERGPGQARRMDLPAFIILDVDFPNAMHGVDMLEKIKKLQQFANIPVFIFTKNSDKAIVANCYVRGANGYFLKPSESNSFTDAVRTLTERWQHIIQRGFGYNYKAV